MDSDYSSSPRDLFLESLKESYGEYELRGHTYHFSHSKQKTIAQELGIDTGRLNKLLNTNDDSISSETFRRYVRQAENLAKAKLYDKLNQKGDALNESHDWGNTSNSKRSAGLSKLGLMIFIGLGIGFWIGQSFAKGAIAYAQEHYIMSDNEEVRVVLLDLLSSNVSDLITDAALFHRRINNSESLDSVQMIVEIKNTIKNVVDRNRVNSHLSQYVTHRGTKLSELLERVTPSEMMYQCSDSMLTYSSLEELPDNATIFDRGVVMSRTYLFSPNTDAYTLSNEVAKLITNAQNGQANAIISILKEEEGY